MSDFKENKFLRLQFTLPLIVFLLLILVFISTINNNPNEVPSVFLNKQLPYFQTHKLNVEPQELIDTKSLLGQVWILNIWASWCQPCLVEHPYITQIANNIPVIGLNYKDETTNAVNWLATHGNPFTYSLVDSEGVIGIDLGVYGVPESFLINKDGTVVYKHIGPLLEDDANKLLNMAQELL